MATKYSDRYLKPPYLPSTGELAVQWGTYEIASALSKDDNIVYFDLPVHAVVIDGFVRGDDLDSDAAETLEVDVGITGTLTKYLNSGVLTGDALADRYPEAGLYCSFAGVLMTSGVPAVLTAKETILATITAAAKAGGTGTLSLAMSYTRDDA